MLGSTVTTPSAAALPVAVLPVAAVAGLVVADHGGGPTSVHDATNADVKTQVHSSTQPLSDHEMWLDFTTDADGTGSAGPRSRGRSRQAPPADDSCGPDEVT
jgi:hypothetical protein